MSAESAKDDQQRDVIGWATDPIRRAKCIAPLNSFASLGSRLRSRRPLIVAGITVLGLLGGAGAALATTGSGTPAAMPRAIAATPSPSATPRGPLPPGVPPAGRHRLFGHGFRGFAGLAPFGFGGLGFGAARLGGPGHDLAMPRTLHGQFVLAKPGGGYQTVDVQSGQVTAISATSITLRSADGYSHAYAVTSSTLVDAQRSGVGSVKVGHEVWLIATVSGGTATAASIADRTLLRQGRHPLLGQGSPLPANWGGGPGGDTGSG
jgi:hypothetical protein